MKYSYSSLSKIGLKRKTNEDSIGVYQDENGLLVIVCDGLGGNNAGDVASKLTVEVIHENFLNSSENDYLEKIKNAILEANRVVLEKAESNFEFKGMATTVEVLFLKENEVYWGHVGDSRMYFYRNGKLKQLTKDHSLVQKLIDEGFLTLKEAENHPNKNIIIRALGDSANLEVDLSKLRFNNNDDVTFFVCTDGVTSVLNDNELEQFLKQPEPVKISSGLSELIEQRGAPDNYSFVIICKNK